MAERLTDCDFSVTSKFDLNLKQMFQEFRGFLETSKSNEPNDTLVFYFSGHGVEYKGVQYFIPVNMEDPEDEKDIIKTAFSCDDAIRDIAEKVSEGLKIIISDACRSEFKKVLNDIGSRTGNTYDSININFDPNKSSQDYATKQNKLVIGPNMAKEKSLCAGFTGYEIPPSHISWHESSVDAKANSKRERKNIIRMCAVTKGEMADAGYGNNLSYYTKALIKHILNLNQSLLSLNIRISEELKFGDAKPEIAIIAPEEIVNTFRFNENGEHL